jgi:hypothetical protein
MTRILFVGQEPETVDFSDPALPPGFSVQKIHAGIAVAMQQFAERRRGSGVIGLDQAQIGVPAVQFAASHAQTRPRGSAVNRLGWTIFLVLALMGSSFAQNPPKAGKKASVQAKSKESTGCRLVGTVRGTKLWAGDCVSAQSAAPPAAETQEPETETKDGIRGGKQ